MSDLNVVELYDYLHTIPELGFEEHKTADFLAENLERLGYSVRRGVGGTGVTGELCGDEPGPTLLLRADMDALRFADGNGAFYNKHACGHDSHCAMVLSAAARLVGRIKKGKLRILFQPGEETGTGALRVIDSGVLEDVDIALGLHNRPVTEIPDGTMTPAVMHGSSCFLKAKITGHGAHGARPHLGINAIDVAAQIISAVNAIRLDPTRIWSCKATGIHGGMVSFNLIPEAAELVFDVRAESNSLMEELLTKVRTLIQGTAAMNGASAEIGFMTGVIPAAELDEELTGMFAEIMKEVVGPDRVMPVVKNPGGEDFHFYTQRYPKLRAGFIGVGAGAAPGLHAKDMELNKYSLQNGVEVMTKMVLRILG